MKREYVTPEISITNFDVSDNTNYVTISANYGFAKKNSFSQVTHLNSQFKKFKRLCLVYWESQTEPFLCNFRRKLYKF